MAPTPSSIELFAVIVPESHSQPSTDLDMLHDILQCLVTMDATPGF